MRILAMLCIGLTLCSSTQLQKVQKKSEKKVKKIILNRKETKVTIIYTDNSKKYY